QARVRGRVGPEQALQVRVVLGAGAGLARASERRELRAAQRERARAPEELRVLGVRGRPSALDVVDAEVVEQPRDLQLVLDREAEPLALCPVPKRRVEELDLHPSPKKQKPRGACPRGRSGLGSLLPRSRDPLWAE